MNKKGFRPHRGRYRRKKAERKRFKKSKTLIEAVRSGNYRKVKKMLNTRLGKESINIRDDLSCSALYISVIHQRYNIPELLLMNGADPNEIPLMAIIAQDGHLNMLKLLIDYGGDVFVISSYDQASLLHRVTLGISYRDHRWNIIQFLLEQGLDPWALNKFNQTPRDNLYKEVDGAKYDEILEAFCSRIFNILFDTLFLPLEICCMINDYYIKKHNIKKDIRKNTRRM